MDKKIQNNIQIDGVKTTTYNNIDLDFSLSFNNLTYTLAYENSKKYLASNSLVFNIEDTNTIYNIFKHNDIQFSYQLNNILFIDNKQNMHILNYNLRNQKTFSYTNNLITFNILDNSVNSLNQFGDQTIFAYNSNYSSYIFSNEDKLKYLTLNKPGLYHIDDDDIILNNGQLNINVNKFNYDNYHINSLVNKINNMIHDYSYNVSLFDHTTKYKDSTHTSNLEINTDNIGKEFDIITSNRKYRFNYNKNGIDVFIKDTDHLIIDIPIDYQYETVINDDFNFNQMICPIRIDDIKIKITKGGNTNIKSSVKFNKSKSFIHNHKPISISPEFKKTIQLSVLKETCNVSLYFNIDSNIYNEVYKLDKQNQDNYKIEFEIIYQNISYKIHCYIDVMDKQFKKLYHDYNYGFNYDNHGEAVGILLFPKITNNELSKFESNSIKIKIDNGTNTELQQINENIIFNPTPKDTFLNYDSNNINNIFIQIKNIDYNQVLSNFINFDRILYYQLYNNSTQISNIWHEDSYSILQEIKYPQRLKCKNLTRLYKNSIDSIPSIYEYPNISNGQKLLLNSNILNNIGTICQFKINENDKNNANNPYIMDKDKHQSLFNTIYNYRKSGLLCGDYYTPCLSDYMTMYLFGIENYFDQNVYKRYENLFCKQHENNQYRLLTNQFYKGRYVDDVCQYSVNLTKNPYDSNNDLDFNKYYIELYKSRNMSDTDQNYIWPLFRIPDYSIINSNDYIIMYNDKENCEYVDYYLNPSVDGKYFYINFKSYNSSYNKDNTSIFKILDEKKKTLSGIQISSTTLIDKKNDIYQMQVYIPTINKINILYIIFQDSEDYMNNITINNTNYRILCKVYLKNKDI